MTNMSNVDGVHLAFVLCCIAFLSGVSHGQLYLQPSSPQAFFTNQEFVVTCYASPGSGANHMTWRSPTGDITDTEGRIHIESDEGEEQKSLRLVVQGVRQADAGNYVCSSQVDGEEVTSTFKLIVYRSITFAGTPEQQNTTKGEDATILCHSVADPAPIISWRNNGSAITNDDHYQKTKAGLEIRNVTRADEGIYTCRAILVAPKNSQVKSIDIHLRVQYAPEWKKPHMEHAYSSVGSTASLVCEAEGYPEPNYTWLWDGDVIESNEVYNVSHHNGRSTLHMVVTNVSQFGSYLCRASNTLDFKERTVKLVEGETPQVPSVSVSHSEPGKMVLKLAADQKSDRVAHEGLKVVGFRVQYRPFPAPWHAAKSRDFTLDDEYVLSGLDRNVDYVVRVAARNAAGLGPFSHEVHHQNQPLAPATVRDIKSDDDGAASTPFHSWSLLHSCLVLSLLVSLSRF